MTSYYADHPDTPHWHTNKHISAPYGDSLSDKEPMNEQPRRKISILNIMFYVFVYLCIAAFGFILGMVYQQLLFTLELERVFSMTNIQINFNATEFTNELNNTFIPAWKQAFNETLNNQLIEGAAP